MALIRVAAIALGLACATVEFGVTTIGHKTSAHRAAHLLSGLAYMGLACVIWTMK